MWHTLTRHLSWNRLWIVKILTAIPCAIVTSGKGHEFSLLWCTNETIISMLGLTCPLAFELLWIVIILFAHLHMIVRIENYPRFYHGRTLVLRHNSHWSP
eukprot:UN03618